MLFGSGHSSIARKLDWLVLGLGPALSHCCANSGVALRTETRATTVALRTRGDFDMRNIRWSGDGVDTVDDHGQGDGHRAAAQYEHPLAPRELQQVYGNHAEQHHDGDDEQLACLQAEVERKQRL